MRRIKEVTLMENPKLIQRMNIVGIGLTVLFYLLFSALASFIPADKARESTIQGLILGMVLLAALIVIHELVHGLFFKLFSPENKVKYGIKNGMAYATSPDSFYSRNQFLWIAIAPFLFVTLLVTALLVLDLISKPLFVLLAAVHAGSCVGDFYYVYLLRKYPRSIRVKDTEKGIDLYAER